MRFQPQDPHEESERFANNVGTGFEALAGLADVAGVVIEIVVELAAGLLEGLGGLG